MLISNDLYVALLRNLLHLSTDIRRYLKIILTRNLLISTNHFHIFNHNANLITLTYFENVTYGVMNVEVEKE